MIANDKCVHIHEYPPTFTNVITSNIENEKGNTTRFLIMGKSIKQPEFKKGKYITSFLFKLKSKPAALYQSLGGFAINGVNLTKLQSFPEKNSFTSHFFLAHLVDFPKFLVTSSKTK